MGISSDKILHKSTVHVKMEAQCFFCTQELPFGFLMVCQNCGIFQSLVQDMVKTCVEKFRRVPKNFVEAWNLFYKESEVKSPSRCRFQRQETCKLPRIKTIAEDSNMDLSAYPLMTSLDHFIPRTQGKMLKNRKSGYSQTKTSTAIQEITTPRCRVVCLDL